MRSRARRCGATTAASRWSSRTPTARSTRAMTVGAMLGEALAVHGLRAAGRDPGAASRELLDLVRLPRRRRRRATRTSSRGGQRQRIGIARALARRARMPDRRRAGLGARRLGAGADRQPAARAAGAARPHRPLRRARPAAGPPHLAPGRGDVSRPHRRDRPRPRRSSPPPPTPTRRRCSAAAPESSTRTAPLRPRRGPRRAAEPARHPARLPLPPALPVSRSTAAGPSGRRWRRARGTGWRRATWWGWSNGR